MNTDMLFFFAKRTIVILPLILLVSGCGSSGAAKETRPVERKLSSYKTILVDVKSEGLATDEEVTQLSSMIVAKLQEQNLFDKVYLSQFTPDAAADLNLDVKIQDITRVSYEKREWLGVFAGKAGVQVTVAMVDTKTNRPVGTFAGEGKSGGHAFAGGTQQAIEKAAETIAEFIRENM